LAPDLLSIKEWFITFKISVICACPVASESGTGEICGWVKMPAYTQLFRRKEDSLFFED